MIAKSLAIGSDEASLGSRSWKNERYAGAMNKSELLDLEKLEIDQQNDHSLVHKRGVCTQSHLWLTSY